MISLHRLSPQLPYQPSTSFWRDKDFEFSHVPRLRSERINAEIEESQKKLENAVIEFIDSKPVYRLGPIFSAQLNFDDQIHALYDDPVVQRIIPGVSAWKQGILIRPDMPNAKFLDVSHIRTVRALPSGLVNRLGWLYVAQTVNIGWFAFVAATGMQKILPESRLDLRRLSFETYTERKRIIINKINQLTLSEVDEERLIAGARAAFGVLQKILTAMFNANCSVNEKGQ